MTCRFPTYDQVSSFKHWMSFWVNVTFLAHLVILAEAIVKWKLKDCSFSFNITGVDCPCHELLMLITNRHVNSISRCTLRGTELCLHNYRNASNWSMQLPLWEWSNRENSLQGISITTSRTPNLLLNWQLWPGILSFFKIHKKEEKTVINSLE